MNAIVGTEGFGRVLAVGRDVENVKVGDRVLAPPLSQTWREKMIVPASGLFPLPEGDPYQLSMLGSNPPTAALILSLATYPLVPQEGDTEKPSTAAMQEPDSDS